MIDDDCHCALVHDADCLDCGDCIDCDSCTCEDDDGDPDGLRDAAIDAELGSR